MSDPLVSILIPAYNAAPWLDATIQSALAQTWSKIEVIVVDDGSKDESASVARRHESARVKVIESENQGSSAARNLALSAAQGAFIQYLDADDLLSADKVESQMQLVPSAPESALITCPIVYFDDGTAPESGRRDPNLPYASDCDSPVEFLLRLFGERGRGGMIQTSQWLTPRPVADKAGPWDEGVSVDNDGEYFARIVLASSGVRYCARGCVFYRKHPGDSSLSAAWSNSEAKVRSGIKAVDVKAARLLGLTARERVSNALAKSYLDWAWMAYPKFPEASNDALAKARALAGADVVPVLSAKGRTLQRLVGWKRARQLQSWWHS
jgi:glycosyltransferase involved in cell wall biosynthesis